MDDVNYGSLPFEEQIKFFLGKLNMPTNRWDDILKSAHDYAFVVAGATKADLLSDLRAAVTKGIKDGTSLEKFREDFDKIVSTHGWTGWTGEGSAAGRAWRTKVIYETNLYTSYAAGQYAQLQEEKIDRPFWKYRHNDNVKIPRPWHVAWDGLILHADDPWWKTHFPPGGFGCKCFVDSLAPRDMKKLGKTGPDKAPDDGEYEWKGEMIPNGIDKGWNYIPGESQSDRLRGFFDNKLLSLDAPIGAAMAQSLKPTIQDSMKKTWTDFVSKALIESDKKKPMATNNAIIGWVVDPEIVQALDAHKKPLDNAAVWLRDDEIIHALRDAKANRNAALSPEVWLNLPSYAKKADAYLDTLDTALIYAFDTPDGLGKAVVRINYSEKIRDSGERKRIVSNFIRTGGIVQPSDLSPPRYVRLR